jgi:hypothetical protein
MKYIKLFNEELDPSTYKRAAGRLRSNYKQSSRADNLISYANELVRKEDVLNGTYECKIVKHKRNQNTKEWEDTELIRGKFHIRGYFDGDWFKDMFHESYDDETYSEYRIGLPFEFGLTPADEETKNLFDVAKENFTDDMWDENVAWTNRIYIPITEEKSNKLEPKSASSFESRDWDMFQFTNRKDAAKFKKLFVDAISGLNNFGSHTEYTSKKKVLMSDQLKNTFKYLIERFNLDSDVDETYQKLVNVSKLISINPFYSE